MNSALQWVVLATAAFSGVAFAVGLIVKGLRKLLVDPVVTKIDELTATKEREHREMDARHAENAEALEHMQRSHNVMRRAFRALLVRFRTAGPDPLSDRAIEDLERLDDELDPNYWRDRRP